MNEERTLVLEMLAAGKIDVAQANELLDGLEPSPAASATASSPAAQAPSLRLSAEQLLALREHDIDARFLRDLQSLGLSALSFDDLLELGVHEVPPKFIRELRDAFPGIDAGQIIELHNHDIDTDFLRELRKANLLGGDPETLIELKEEREQSGDA